ncbi:uncharacterized protein LOC119468850 [Cebus imitator]|uniref:uncharacterized protein LOC119468850 n=1 Tax=Cebus imitator TaxID=2715852 RepID=UPI00189BE46C|nr:uncharacterized protein LOC119468850 [Cebus imitator]
MCLHRLAEVVFMPQKLHLLVQPWGCRHQGLLGPALLPPAWGPHGAGCGWPSHPECTVAAQACFPAQRRRVPADTGPMAPSHRTRAALSPVNTDSTHRSVVSLPGAQSPSAVKMAGPASSPRARAPLLHMGWVWLPTAPGSSEGNHRTSAVQPGLLLRGEKTLLMPRSRARPDYSMGATRCHQAVGREVEALNSWEPHCGPLVNAKDSARHRGHLPAVRTTEGKWPCPCPGTVHPAGSFRTGQGWGCLASFTIGRHLRLFLQRDLGSWRPHLWTQWWSQEVPVSGPPSVGPQEPGATNRGGALAFCPPRLIPVCAAGSCSQPRLQWLHGLGPHQSQRNGHRAGEACGTRPGCFCHLLGIGGTAAIAAPLPSARGEVVPTQTWRAEPLGSEGPRPHPEHSHREPHRLTCV